MLTKQKLAFLKTALNITDEEVEAGSNPHGFIPQAKGAEYKDEESKTGWRVQNLKPKKVPSTPEEIANGAPQMRDETNEEFLARKQRIEQSDGVLTRHFTDEERKDATLRPDTDGVLRHNDGEAPSGTFNYVTDVDSGEMVTGPTHERKAFDRGFAEDGTKKADGHINTHHSSMLRGADVASAGVVSFTDGEIDRISNESGHYKPQFVHLLQVVEHLMSAGALLDKTLVDFEGRDAETAHPEAFKLYGKMKPIVAELPADKKLVQALNQKLDKGEITADQRGMVDAALKTLDTKIALVKKFFTAMGKLGIGPRNAFSDDATVEMAFIDPTMTGIEARRAKTKELSPEDFVRGSPDGADGNVYRERQTKDAMLDEFKKVAKKAKIAETVEEGNTFTGQAADLDQDQWLETLKEIEAEFDQIAPGQGYPTDGADQGQDDGQPNADPPQSGDGGLFYTDDMQNYKSGSDADPVVYYQPSDLDDPSQDTDPPQSGDGTPFYMDDMQDDGQPNTDPPQSGDSTPFYMDDMQDDGQPNADPPIYYEPSDLDDPSQEGTNDRAASQEDQTAPPVDYETAEFEVEDTAAISDGYVETDFEPEETAPVSDGYVDPDIEDKDTDVISDGYVETDFEPEETAPVSDGYVDPDLEDK